MVSIEEKINQDLHKRCIRGTILIFEEKGSTRYFRAETVKECLSVFDKIYKERFGSYAEDEYKAYLIIKESQRREYEGWEWGKLENMPTFGKLYHKCDGDGCENCGGRGFVSV